MKAQAARIGPTVWEEEGPIPMENMSKTLIMTYSNYGFRLNIVNFL
jgi:hypothetical protein